jgi:ATP-dependent DNA ligase
MTSTEQGSFMMQGTKKQAMRKKTAEKRRSRSKRNRDIAGSMKSMSSSQTKNGRLITEKKIIKIQGGGEHGQDKVKLNVKFTSTA